MYCKKRTYAIVIVRIMQKFLLNRINMFKESKMLV